TNTMPSSPADRRARLLSGKLAAIVRDAVPGAATTPGSFPPGAALLAGDGAWVGLDTSIDDGIGLGAAILWAGRNGAAELDLVAAAPLGVAARRAREFDLPIRVWALDGIERRVVPPAPVRTPPSASEAHLAFVDDIVAAGATVVVEHGV